MWHSLTGGRVANDVTAVLRSYIALSVFAGEHGERLLSRRLHARVANRGNGGHHSNRAHSHRRTELLHGPVSRQSLLHASGEREAI